MHDSKKPSRNLTAIRPPKVFAAAEQATTAPQQRTLHRISQRPKWMKGRSVLSRQELCQRELLQQKILRIFSHENAHIQDCAQPAILMNPQSFCSNKQIGWAHFLSFEICVLLNAHD